MKPKYKCVLIKVSGEAMAGEQKFGINEEITAETAKQLKEVVDAGVQLVVVPGGGNFWRGRSTDMMDRCAADYIGMLGTMMNAIALREALEDQGVPAVVQTAIEMDQIAECFNARKARAHLDEGKVVIFGCGTGHPFFSTDTTASLRAIETGAEVVLMAKAVDAVYSDDPKTNPDAIRYTHLTHEEVLKQDLKVMDSTAAALCKDNGLAIHVFGLAEENGIMKAICGEEIGTIVE